MNYQNYLIDAVNDVLSWDIPDESLAEAVTAQASLMARIDPDEMMTVFATDWIIDFSLFHSYLSGAVHLIVLLRFLYRSKNHGQQNDHT